LTEPVLVQKSVQLGSTFSIFRISGNGALEAERQVVGNILTLSTPPFRLEVARRRFPPAQLRAAEETLRLTADIRVLHAAAANELVELLIAAQSTVTSTTELQRHPGDLDGHKKSKEVRRCKKARRRPHY
jgi:hypothetical protein